MDWLARMIERPIGRRLGIVISAVVVLLIVYFPIRDHTKFERAIIAQTHNQLLTTSRSIASSIHDHIDILSRSIEVLAGNAEIQRALKDWDPGRARFTSTVPEDVFKAHERHAYALYLIDARGNLVRRYPAETGYRPGSVNLADKPDIAAVLDLKLPSISKPFRARTGNLVVSTSVPIFDRSGGDFVGIARWLIKMDTIADDFISPMRIGESGYAQLVDENGLLLASPEAGRQGRHLLEMPVTVRAERDWSPLEQITDAMAAGNEGTGIVDIPGPPAAGSVARRKLIAYTPVPFEDHRWSVLMSMDYDEVSAPIVASARENLLFLCAVIGIISLAAWKHLHMQRQLAVKEGDRQLITFLETLPIGIVVITPDGNPFYANSAAEKILGRDGTGVDILALFGHAYSSRTGGKYPREGMPVLRALAGEPSSASDIELRKDGRVVPLELHGYPIHAANGEIRFAVGAFQDITARRKAEQEIADSQQRLALHAQQTPLGVIEWDLDFRVAEWNKAAERVFGYSREDALERHGSFIVPEAARPRVDEVWREILASPDGHRTTIEHVTRDARSITCEWYSTPLIDAKGGVIGAASLVQDITDRIRMEHSLVQARQDWEDTFSLISDTITIHDNQYNIVASNKAAQEVLGLPGGPDSAPKCFRYYHGAQQPPRDCLSCKCLDADKEVVSEAFEPHLNRYLEVRAIPRIDATGVRKGIIHVVRDITDRKKLEEELRQRAFYDSLTGLPNRMLFLDRLKNLFAHLKRQKDLLFAVFFIDLDHFKKINDTAGHSVGDHLLVAVADRLKNCTRPGDTISRFGGDEFLIIVDGLKDAADAGIAAERIAKSFAAPFSVAGSEMYITASIGIALLEPDSTGPEDLIRNADLAMYRAKSRGRSQYMLYDHSMHGDALQSLKIENELRTAIRRGEFINYYQPVIDIANGEVYGFEALVRWPHPVEGMLFPGMFIPIAEETGLIIPLGEWVIRTACRQIKEWREQYPTRKNLFVSVNVSAKQFNEHFPDVIAEILSDTGLAPDGLRIEITESLLMEHKVVAHEVLTKLRAMGIAIYLDDFGTGYSSLNYLHKFPISALKIDQTFVMNIVKDRQAQEIIKAIAMLAMSLNLLVIVEGVEAYDQLQFFRGLRCDLIQGFLFSEAVAGSAARSFIINRTPTGP